MKKRLFLFYYYKMQNVDDENVVIMNWDPFYKDRRGTSHQISTEGRDTDLVFCVRNANTSSGRHFHEGKLHLKRH